MLNVHRIIALLLLCFTPLAAHADDGDFVWARGMGGASFNGGTGIAVDNAGNVYTTGAFSETVDFDPGEGTYSLTSAGDIDVFVQKLDASGNLVWARGMGGTGQDIGYGIAVDGAGNVYTTGPFEGTVDFDPGAGTVNLTSAGYDDIFVQKLDASGSLVWARVMGGTSSDIGRDIAVDSSGNAYTTGYFQTKVDFDPGSGTFNLTSAGLDDIFVQKLDGNGSLIWARGMGGTIFDSGTGIAVDSTGNVYTTGYFIGTVDIDPGANTVNLVSAGSYDIFLQKLDTSGNFVWARGMGGSGSDIGWSIALDTSDNVYTTGLFYGTADFDPGSGTVNLISTGSFDIFVQKLDTSGNFVWARGVGGNADAFSYAIGVDRAGNVYTTGDFEGTANFDPGVGTVNLSSGGGSDIFVQNLDASGSLVWARGVGGTTDDFSNAIALDSAGNVYATGNFSGTVDFDPGAGTENLTSTGGRDIFVLKMAGPDVTPPSAITISPETTGPTNETSVAFNVTFDEEVKNFDALADLTLTHSGTSSTGASVVGGPIIYTATVTGISGDGSFTLAVNTGSDVQDLAGNPLAISVTSAAVTIDNTPPTVSIGVPAGSPVNSGDTATYPIIVDGTSSINLSSANVTIHHNGTAGGSVVIVDGASETPTVQVSSVTGDGSYRIGIAAGVATDAAGNLSLAAGPSAAVSVDNKGPEFGNVVANPAEVSAGDTVSISFDSSEPVVGEPEVKVNGNPAVRLVKEDFGYEYTVQSRDELGAATITITATDALGNVGALGDSTLLDIVRAEGEGDVEGEGEGSAEGSAEGDGTVEGTQEGEGEVIAEGAEEGEGEGENPPAGCGGCNAAGGPMEKSLGDWLAMVLGFAVLLGAHLSLRSRMAE